MPRRCCRERPPQDWSSRLDTPSQGHQLPAIPQGFGFLVAGTSEGEHNLLACTFLHQKFPQRAPAGATLLRAFFASSAADSLSRHSDERDRSRRPASNSFQFWVRFPSMQTSPPCAVGRVRFHNMKLVISREWLNSRPACQRCWQLPSRATALRGRRSSRPNP